PIETELGADALDVLAARRLARHRRGEIARHAQRHEGDERYGQRDQDGDQQLVRGVLEHVVLPLIAPGPDGIVRSPRALTRTAVRPSWRARLRFSASLRVGK